MKRNYKLSASLICSDFMHFAEDLAMLEKEKIDSLHIDVMDGVFVPRYGMFPEFITQIRKLNSIPMDVHMMVSNPEKYIETFVRGGLDQKDDVLVVHAESTQHLDLVLRQIKRFNIKSGVALNPATPLSVLDYVIDDIDLVMIMAINPGIIGHKLIPNSIKKIADLKEKLKMHSNILIEIDGGVNFSSAPKMIETGANMLVCGTQTIFQQNEPIDLRIKKLREEIDNVLK